MKPILFNTEMVRAILDDRKTVTRRLVKPQPRGHAALLTSYLLPKTTGTRAKTVYAFEDGAVASPPYHSDDVIYVREAWQEVYENEVDEDAPCGFVNIRERILNFDEIPKVEAGISRNCATATMKPRMRYFVFKASDIEYANPQNGLYWRPSIHMPREAARIFLRVTDVRVERLKNMPHDGPLKEGVRWRDCPDGFTWKNDSEIYCCYTTPMGAMRALWDNTIKPKDRALYGWEANPWVFVISFERISRDEALQ